MKNITVNIGYVLKIVTAIAVATWVILQGGFNGGRMTGLVALTVLVTLSFAFINMHKYKTAKNSRCKAYLLSLKAAVLAFVKKQPDQDDSEEESSPPQKGKKVGMVTYAGYEIEKWRIVCGAIIYGVIFCVAALMLLVREFSFAAMIVAGMLAIYLLTVARYSLKIKEPKKLFKVAFIKVVIWPSGAYDE